MSGMIFNDDMKQHVDRMQMSSMDRLVVQVVPTDNHRHMTGIRLGKLPGDIFSKKHLATIMVDPDVVIPDQPVTAKTIAEIPVVREKKAVAAAKRDVEKMKEKIGPEVAETIKRARKRKNKNG